MKMKPYGGPIGIDNSSLDKYFKSYKIVRLHAILHEVSGFVFEYSGKRAGLFVCPYLSGEKRVPWSRDKTCLLFLCKNFFKQSIQFAGMLKSGSVVLDFEGFRHKKPSF